MEEINQNRIDYPIVQFTQRFRSEVKEFPDDRLANRKVFKTPNNIWEYIPTTNLRLYWLNKKTWIHKLVEIRWHYYLQQDLYYPRASFRSYLLEEKGSVEFYPDSVSKEISIWFDIRNKILQ